MKQSRIRIIILGLILGMMLSAVSVLAKDASIEIDGLPLNTPQKPLTRAGVTLVPMRAIFEALGAEVEWDNTDQTISVLKGDQFIILTLYGYQAFSVNGITLTVERTTMPYPAVSINNTTYVPLRFVGEALGADVNWDATQGKITITSDPLTPTPTDEVTPELLQETTNNLSISAVYGGYFENYPGKFIGPQMEHCIKNATWSAKILSETNHIVSVSGVYEGSPIVISFSCNPLLEEIELIDVVKNGSTLSETSREQFLTKLLTHSLR